MNKENKLVTENKSVVEKTGRFMVRGDEFPEFKQTSIYQCVNTQLLKRQLQEREFNTENIYTIAKLYENRAAYLLDLALKDSCLRYYKGELTRSNGLYTVLREVPQLFNHISIEEISYNNISEEDLIERMFYSGMVTSEIIFNKFLTIDVTPLTKEEQQRFLTTAQEVADIYNMVYLKLATECYFEYAPLYNPKFAEQQKGLKIMEAYFNIMNFVSKEIPSYELHNIQNCIHQQQQ